jgi:hypothetical protein
VSFLAQVADPRLNFWAREPNSQGLWIMVAVAFIAGLFLMFALSKAPTRSRRPIVVFFTFVAGLFYVAYWIWPQPISRGALDVPRNTVEQVSFLIADTQPRIADMANILTGFLLGLGIYSLLRIHVGRLARKHEDRFFSGVLLVSMFTILVAGYWDWNLRLRDPDGKLDTMANWGPVNFAQDFLLDGLLQQMDAAMFSMIAFFILSAAYRAFRIRSVEATVMMSSALILMLSLMGGLVFGWNTMINNVVGGGNAVGFHQNFHINEVANWVRANLQTPALRAVEFGVGLGALAMGLRLWLGLEKGGVTT